jgi:hypothetical protein
LLASLNFRDRVQPWLRAPLSEAVAVFSPCGELRRGLCEGLSCAACAPSFGPETYLAEGYPFSYLIRDILQV